jgi:uncharacterized heparinase superfamily protein
LWRYNLHYFDDLLASDAAHRLQQQVELIERWIRENPAGIGTGWEPYPTSLRIVNWCKWLLLHGGCIEPVLHSLAVQARWLEKRIEHHLLGNHLWVNGKALVFAGTFFCGPESDRWLAAGLDILRRELTEQVLADGAHFERTPMYHALFVEDLLDLSNLADTFGDRVPAMDRERWRLTAPRMIAWLRAVSHGTVLAHFNDVAQDVAPRLSELAAYAGRLAIDSQVCPSAEDMLACSGLVRLESGDAVVIADVAPLGPDYMPGHAHADTLSFEFSIRGHRLLVNEGTSTYEADEERLRQRGTAAHNTVIVDGADSSEVWSSFRVARRARILDAALVRAGPSITLTAVHDGYRRLPGRVLHRRTWHLRERRLEVVDELEGRFASAESRLLLAPGWIARPDQETVRLDGPGGSLVLRVDGGSPRIESGVYHAGFGSREVTQRISAGMSGCRLVTCIEW